MQFRNFFAFLVLLSYQSTEASEFESPEELKRVVESFIKETLIKELNITDSNDIDVKVSNIDSRLKLKQCEDGIQKNINSIKPYGNNLSVKLSCNSQQRWSIYVPSQVSIYTDIAVLTQTLERGSIITEDDIKLQRTNTPLNNKDYITKKSTLLGMQLKRRLAEGQALRLSQFKLAQIVKKGDKVVVEANSSTFSVVTTGKALNSGHLGQQIQVRNTQSKRIVEARVIAPGRVEITL